MISQCNQQSFSDYTDLQAASISYAFLTVTMQRLQYLTLASNVFSLLCPHSQRHQAIIERYKPAFLSSVDGEWTGVYKGRKRERADLYTTIYQSAKTGRQQFNSNFGRRSFGDLISTRGPESCQTDTEMISKAVTR